jgi:DNA-binding NarL/FixJ family response regulator
VHDLVDELLVHPPRSLHLVLIARGLSNQDIAEQRPAVLLLDTDLPGEGVLTVLARIVARGSQSRCLVLADSIQQRQEARAAAAGADAVLPRDGPIRELNGAVTRSGSPVLQ